MMATTIATWACRSTGKAPTLPSSTGASAACVCTSHAHADAVTERLQALSGLMDVTGAREDQPTMIGDAGMFAPWGVMAARDRLFEYPNL